MFVREPIRLRRCALQRGIHALGACVLSFVASAAFAANVLTAHHDPQTDEIVAQVAYRGTNADHEFSLRWDECKPLQDESVSYEVSAQVVDSQWDDLARQEFSKTVRFELDGLTCRPARVSLHTAAGFVQTLHIPEATDPR